MSEASENERGSDLEEDVTPDRGFNIRWNGYDFVLHWYSTSGRHQYRKLRNKDLPTERGGRGKEVGGGTRRGAESGAGREGKGKG